MTLYNENCTTSKSGSALAVSAKQDTVPVKQTHMYT